MAIPLEDNFNDIIGKAMRGLGVAESTVAKQAGLTMSDMHQLREGDFHEIAVRKIAPVLGLNAEALVASGLKAWSPAPVSVPGLAQFNTPYHDMMVNAYLVWDESSGEAIAFDTGADCSDMLAHLQEKNLKLKAILLTHTHGDHIFELDRLMAKTSAPAFVGEREPLPGATSFPAGRTFEAGSLKIETRSTWGHSPGGITYVINGLARPIAVVGDAVFAGSMGGGAVSYADALRTNREAIMTLPDETVLCPGHGPMTTVGEERRHNPFFA